jgi:hypothetical protein
MAGMNGDMYFQSADYTKRLYTMFRQQIIKLAINRFKWINLPKECNERYLERTLLYQGIATIAFPKYIPWLKGQFFSTQVIYRSPPDVYDNPTKWRSIGNNGWNFSCDYRNGVIVWDNRPRYPLIETVELYARDLADIRRTQQINRMHTKTPYIINCAPEQEQQALNIYKQIAGYEPAIITTNLTDRIEINAIQTGVQFIGEELNAAELNMWAQVYQALGIENLSFKAERMVQDEVNKRDEPSDILSLDGLNCRREACKQLNDRFSEYLDKPIDCVWAKDNESVNFNTVNNLQDLSALDSGGDSDVR